ncbi:MAG: hypothetical protein Q8L81_16010 [Bacteroidota bacterium]|nr:hypothetical protein [Bacteroidota bacterium]
MTEVLDFLYSSVAWMTVIICVVMFLCVGFAFANPFKNKKINYAYKIFLYFFAFCFMMSFEFFYYGYTDEFKKMCIGKTTICLLEQYERGGGEGPSENVCRLHIIDKVTGVRKERHYVGHTGQLVGMRNDTLCYFNNQDVVLFDAANLKEIYSIKKEEWGTISPELSVGMESIYSGNDMNTVSPLVELNCKNAKKYWFDPFAKRLLDKEPEKNYTPGFSNNSYELTVKYNANKQVNYLKDEYAGSNTLKRIVPGYSSRNLFTVKDSSTYIDPFFLCIDTLKKVFVFGHYTTTDRFDYFLESKDFDFITKWKKISTDLVNDSYNKPKVNVWQYLDGVLYFNNGGFVIALDPVTSKTYWTTRL